MKKKLSEKKSIHGFSSDSEDDNIFGAPKPLKKN